MSSPCTGATGYATVRCCKVPDHNIEEYTVLLMCFTERDIEDTVRELLAAWTISLLQHVLDVYLCDFRSR